MRSVLSLLTVAVICSVVAPQSADAGLFGCFKKRSSCSDCCPDPCAAPAPSCCAPVAPTCCAPAPVHCAPEPVCCTPEPVCCDPCAQPRQGFFKRLLSKCRLRGRGCKSDCCAPEPCCEPAPVTCCAPAAPSCCAPAAPSCCAPAPAPCGPCGGY